MKQVLSVLGEAEVKKLLEEHNGIVSVSCDFCNQKYLFDPIDVTMLFHK